MVGEQNLSVLISSMSPSLNQGHFVFCTLNDNRLSTKLISNQEFKGLFVENEGVTFIIDEHTADKYDIDYDSLYSCITLNVHSSLDAVGLTAAVSMSLAEKGISANVVAAYYHDHIFVAAKHAQQAMHTLQALANAESLK